jgi:hypothetical protein
MVDLLEFCLDVFDEFESSAILSGSTFANFINGYNKKNRTVVI